MKNNIFFIGVILIVVLTIVLLIAYPKIQHARAQEDLITDLKSRLEQDGVKVVSIELKDKSSSFPEITIQRIENKDKLSGGDILALHLTEREAIYSYLFGHSITDYTLISVDPNGEQASWEQASTNSDRVSKIPDPFTSTTADNDITKELIEKNLDLMGFHLDQVNVQTGVGSRKDVQQVDIFLSTDNLDLVNSVSRRFIESLRPFINKLNQEQDVRILLLMVHLRDNNGKPLLEYLWDVQLDIVRSNSAKEINAWYSEPPPPNESVTAPPPIVPTETNEPFSPPNPLVYPPPSGTPYP